MISMPNAAHNLEAPPLKTMTFQNAKVRAVHNYDGTPPNYWCVQDAAGSHSFPAEEWEMKVEFKRRPKPLVVGDHVAVPGDEYGIIDAISEAAGKKEYWVRHDISQGHATYYENELKRDASDD